MAKYIITTAQRITDRSLKRLSGDLPPGVESLEVGEDGSLEASADAEGLVYAALMPRLMTYGVSVDSVDEVKPKPKPKSKAKPRARSTTRKRKD